MQILAKKITSISADFPDEIVFIVRALEEWNGLELMIVDRDYIEYG